MIPTSLTLVSLKQVEDPLDTIRCLSREVWGKSDISRKSATGYASVDSLLGAKPDSYGNENLGILHIGRPGSMSSLN